MLGVINYKSFLGSSSWKYVLNALNVTWRVNNHSRRVALNTHQKLFRNACKQVFQSFSKLKSVSKLYTTELSKFEFATVQIDLQQRCMSVLLLPNFVSEFRFTGLGAGPATRREWHVCVLCAPSVLSVLPVKVFESSRVTKVYLFGDKLMH